MRKLIILSTLALIAVSAAGCNNCGRPRFNLFNRGAECCEPPCMSSMDGGGWVPRSAGMVPSGPAMMPGELEVLPAN
jgi:ribosomal protein L37AE/L43A